MKEEKSEMGCPDSAREHEPIMFPQAHLPDEGGGSASAGGSTALPCRLCMNGVEC